MSEVELDQYQIQDLNQMISWCRQQFAAGTWKVIFSLNSIKLQFDRGRDAVAFSQQWK